MIAPQAWQIIREALEKVVPCILKSQQQLESEAAIKRMMQIAERDLRRK